MSAPSLPHAFARRTLAHLAAAAVALAALLGVWLLVLRPGEVRRWTCDGPLPFLLPVAFLGAAGLARRWGESGLSRPWQYAGLGLHVLAQAAVLAPPACLALAYLGAWALLPALGYAVLAAGCVLAEMRRILCFFPPDRPEAGALALSAAVAAPFWYAGRLLRCVVASRD